MPKLMLVEDDNNLREIYEARLQAEGYEIVSAKDGEEALVLAKAQKPDLIIADVMMPKISGFEMLDILRNTEGLKQVKVIMLTALGQNDDQKLANRLGANRYLVKSQVTLEDIVKVTHELLGDEQAPPDASAVVPPPTTPAPPQPPAGQPATTPAVDTPAATGSVTADPAPPPDPKATAEPAGPAAGLAPDPVSAPPTAGFAANSITPAGPTRPAETTPAVAVINGAAQSTTQEEASVDNRIEDFVAGATEDPTPTTTAPSSTADGSEPVVNEPADPAPAVPVDPAPEPAPSPPPEPVASEASAPVAVTDAANDDKLVADAAQKLVDSTEEEAPQTPPAADIASAQDSPKPADTSDDRRTKRIIAPLDTKPKRDLDTLLALEEAKEATTTPLPAATPIVVVDNPGQPATSPQNPVVEPVLSEDTASGEPASSAEPVVTVPNDPADPNNIAL